MATFASIVVLALLLTGVAATTVYALPVLSQVTAASAQKGDNTQTQDQQQLQKRDGSGDMTQTQERLRFRDGSQNCNGPCAESSISNQGGSEQPAGYTYQNQYCEQNHVCAQNSNGGNLETNAME